MVSIVVPNIVCGVAFSLVMIPLMTIAFVTLKNSQMTNATGIFNLAKSVGGAIGTSAVATLVSRMSQVHQTHLIRNLTDANLAFVEKFNAIQGGITMMSGNALSAIKANTVIYKQLIQQSTLMAYMDCFKIYAAMLIMLVPLIFLFKKVKYKKNKA
jgi:DHA2 family multidrug resistance protein